MAVLGTAYDFGDYSMAIFKGDDSGIMSSSEIKFKDDHFVKQHGFKLKIDTSTDLEFAGMFLNRYGGCPDILRVSQKFLSKFYVSQSLFDESVINLRASLDLIRDATNFNYGCTQVARYYNETNRVNHVLPAHVKVLGGFMYHESFRSFDQLTPYHRDILVFNKNGTLAC
jgi:hypothetical protein